MSSIRRTTWRWPASVRISFRPVRRGSWSGIWRRCRLGGPGPAMPSVRPSSTGNGCGLAFRAACFRLWNGPRGLARPQSPSWSRGGGAPCFGSRCTGLVWRRACCRMPQPCGAFATGRAAVVPWSCWLSSALLMTNSGGSGADGFAGSLSIARTRMPSPGCWPVSPTRC